MSYVVVTTCTGRKRAREMPVVTLSWLESGSLGAVTTAWLEALATVSDRRRADELYCGRTVVEAKRAAQALNSELWFISTGLGLIKSTLEIPAYDLTVAQRGSSWITDRISGEKVKPQDWWKELTARNPDSGSIRQLLHAHPEATVLVALSAPYARMIERDLASLDEGTVARLRLFGRRLENVLDDSLHRCIMPYDARLDGPDSPVPGTRGDFAQRALRHFSEEIIPLAPRADCAVHQRMVSQALVPMKDVDWPRRTPKSDTEIIELILRHWKEVGGGSQAMLRHLRDTLQVACEQARFRDLFVRARTQRDRKPSSLFHHTRDGHGD